MAEKIPERKDISEGHKWDISPLFKSDKEWESLFEKIEEEIKRYNSFTGRLDESIKVFKEALEFDLAISRKLEKIYTYAQLKSDENKSDQYYLGLYQRALNLYTRVSETSSFLTPEIQSIPDEKINKFINSPELREYRFYLEKILRFKPHTLSREIEEILAMSGEISHTSIQIFSQLDNADMKFGIIKDERGNEIELSHGNFNSFLLSQSREVRKNAFFQYYRAYEDHKNTISTTLAYSYKKDFFYSRVRKFQNSRSSALFTDNIPDEVYDNLIETVKKNLSPLFKYLKFRKGVLGLSDLHFYDTSVPIIKDIDFNMPYEEAVDVCTKAIEILGENYKKTLRDGLSGGWVDRYENRGKRSGAYSSGCYDSPPYILMNYKDDNINSLYTLMHEAGHSMHSYYSKNYQAYLYHDYTIFVAEVASTFNETLLSKYLLDEYKDNPRMKAYIINREIDNIRGTLFRQTMFAEFEKISHGIIEENKPLTLDVIRDIYHRLLEIYFGDTIVIDDELTLESLRIPHFYSAFYVYKYATGISAAIALVKKVLNEGDSARDAYLDFLKLGGSKFPLDELLDAGVDMRTPEAVEDAIAYFSELVEQLIEVCKIL